MNCGTPLRPCSGASRLPVDFAVFVAGSLFALITLVLGIMLKDWKWGALIAFMGGVFGALFVTYATGDGTIAVSYTTASPFTGATTDVYPLVLFPIFLTLLNFVAMAVRSAQAAMR